MRNFLHAYLVLLALAGTSGSRADVYLYKDATGIVHYSNVPEHDQYEQIVALLKEEGTSNRAGAAPGVGDMSQVAPHVEEAAAAFQVEEALVHAVITAESGYNSAAVSKKGAVGLMQLMPQTARRYGVRDPFDPAQNVRGGTQYLSELLKLFNNDLKLAVAAYNAGEKAVQKHGNRIPPYRETLAYVPKVLRLYKRLGGKL
jgi:soluble lytic murein transglycosylase-like protein